MISALGLLAACATAPTPTPETASGAVLVAQAPQSDPPALYINEGRVTAAWIDEDSVGVHQAAREDGRQVVVLPLPPDQPRAQMLYPGGRLLWLDRERASGETRLFSALLTPDLGVARGPTLVSTARTLRYAAAPGASGRLWALWLGGVISEPVLHVQSLDGQGRPLPPRVLASNVVDFALAAAADGAFYALWIDGGDGGVYLAHLREGETLDTRRLTSGVALASGDLLDSLRAGLEGANGCVFWNITRAEGQPEVWWTCGALAGAAWPPPAPLETPILRAAPLAVEQSPLPVAVQTAQVVGLALVQDGRLLDVAPLADGVRLLAPPAVYTDEDGRLYVAWADAASDEGANLMVSPLP